MNNTHEEFREAINQAMFGEQDKSEQAKSKKESLSEALKSSNTFLCACKSESDCVVGGTGSNDEFAFLLIMIINCLKQKGFSHNEILAAVLTAQITEQKFKENSFESDFTN